MSSFIISQSGYYQKVIDYLEQPEFYGSKEFIASKLSGVSERPLYIPGQNEVMDFIIQIHCEPEGQCVDDIIYQGKSVFYDEGREKPKTMDYPKTIACYRLRQEISEKVAAPLDRVRLQYDVSIENKVNFIVSKYGFVIKY